MKEEEEEEEEKKNPPLPRKYDKNLWWLSRIIQLMSEAV